MAFNSNRHSTVLAPQTMSDVHSTASYSTSHLLIAELEWHIIRDTAHFSGTKTRNRVPRLISQVQRCTPKYQTQIFLLMPRDAHTTWAQSPATVFQFDPVAARILTVGDAERAVRISLLMQNTSTITSKRGFTTINGTYKGVPVTIIAIGMVC